MIGGAVADMTGDVRHSILVMIVYSVLVLPVIRTLDLTPARRAQES